MSTFYTDHWKEIEPERLARYEELFQFRAEQEPFLAALDLEGNPDVLDFGCGPGFLTEEIASRTTGRVVGADLNAEFVARAQQRQQPDHLEFIHLSGRPLIDDIGQVERLICKNVLEYVPDLSSTISEFFDVLAPGGRVALVDSDWGFVLVEPWGKDTTDRFFKAASAAFREPYAGRQLPGKLSAAGFNDVTVKVIAGVDRKGRGIHVIKNMESYIRQFDTLPDEDLKQLMSDLEAGLHNGSFMFILPQFIVAATKP